MCLLSPQLADLVGFMTIKGTSHLLDGNQIQVSMLAGEEANFSIDLITPLGTELNTRIVVNIITRGGLNPDGFPYQLENNILTVVDKQRIVEVDIDNLEMDRLIRCRRTLINDKPDKNLILSLGC